MSLFIFWFKTMFNFFIFGKPKVKEKDGKIIVTDIHHKTLENDIKRLYNTSRVSNQLFTSFTRGSFTIESFFALELFNIINDLAKARQLGTNVRALVEIQKGLIENTWLGKTQRQVEDRLNFNNLKRLKLQPLDFQDRFLKAYSQIVNQYELRGLLLAGAAGSGKTYTSLALMECRDFDHVIVVCPKNALYRVWESTIATVFHNPQTYWIGNSGKDYNKERFIVVHYEAMHMLEKLLPKIKGKRVGFILDESHNMNELTSQRTKLFLELVIRSEAEDVVLASGTPIKALAIESVPLLMAIDPKFNTEVSTRFKRMFAGDANKATSILAQRLGIVSFKIEKSELKLEKPIFKNIPVKIPNGKDFTLNAIRVKMSQFISDRMDYYENRRKEFEFTYYSLIEKAAPWLDARGKETKALMDAYNAYKRNVNIVKRAHDNKAIHSVGDFIKETNRYENANILPRLDGEDKKRFREAKTVHKYLSLKVQGECLGRVVSRARIEAHTAMVKHIPFDEVLSSTSKKTVVFTSYVETLEETKRHLEQGGGNPITVYGANTNELSQSVAKFEKDESINPLIATYASLSTAVPLVMADTMLLINAPFRDYTLQQAVSRIHRLGADTQTYVYTTVLDTDGEPNISSRNFDILEWSQSQIESIMKIESPFKLEYNEDGTVNETE